MSLLAFLWQTLVTAAPWVALVQAALLLGLASFAPMGQPFRNAFLLTAAAGAAGQFFIFHPSLAKLMETLASEFKWQGLSKLALEHTIASLANTVSVAAQPEHLVYLAGVITPAVASHQVVTGLFKRHCAEFELLGIALFMVSAGLAIFSTYGLLFPVFASSLFLGIRRASTHHRVIEGKQALRDMYDGLLRLRVTLLPHTCAGIRVHDFLRIPKSFESRGIIVFGAPGSGKSHLIKTFFLPQFRERKDRVVVFDYKGEFTQNMGEDADVLILSPLDARSVVWDIARDINSEAKAWEFGRMVVQKGDSSQDEVFEDWARDLLTASVIKLQQEKGQSWTFQDFYRDSQNLETLQLAVKRYRPESQFAANFSGDSRQFEAIKGTIRRALVRLEPLARAWASPASDQRFSIQGWLEGKGPAQTTVIVRYDPLYGETMGPFVSCFFNFLFTSVLSLEDARGEQADRRIWAVLDEFQILPKIPKLFEAARAGRSKGLRLLLGTQDLGQTDQMYRKEGSRDTLVNLIGFKFIGHLGSQGMQDFAAGLLSKNKTRVFSRNIQQAQGKESVSFSEQERFEPAISPGEFGAIPVPTPYGGALFWMVHQGWAPVRLRFITRQAKDGYASLVPAPWLSDGDRVRPCEQEETTTPPGPPKKPTPIGLGKALAGLDRSEGTRC